MSGPFVVDSSVGVGWVHPGQAMELTRRLLDEAKAGVLVHVPALWHLAMANALLMAVRRKLMTDLHRQKALALLGQLRLSVDEETSEQAFFGISELAARYGLTVYDAAYLELAQRRALPLGSRDAALCSAAKKCGVKLL